MPKNVEFLKNNINARNIAEDMDEIILESIGRKCMYGYNRDCESRIEWEKQTEEGLKIARQITEQKNYPFAGASNVKYPLIATAAIQFASRAYPQIIQGENVVKAMCVGELTPEKEARALRVGMHMSYQLMEQMEEWESDTDQLLTSLPVVGMYFRKTYFDPLWGRNMSISVSPLDLVINQQSKSMVTARRLSERIMMHRNDVIEREQSGIFREGSIECMETEDDEDSPELFIEQHGWLDLDEDGYQEPYIITIHAESEQVVRIVARYDEDGIKINSKGKIVRIEPVHYFTDYGFLPDPSGGFYKLGFAHLLGPINESISTCINQLLDAGHLANVQGGFLGNGVRIPGGTLRIKPGQFQPVDVTGGTLRDNIFPFPFKEPSQVLFNLLGLLTEAGMKLAAVSETMTGEMPGQNTPATTVLAMIEQGLKVFTSIYKRVFRSLKSEYKKLYRLNRLYMDETEYINILDTNQAIFREDYDLKDLNVVPVADPTISSEAQRLARAQALLNTMQFNPTVGGKVAILQYYYDAITGMPSMTKMLLPEKELNAPPPPNPELLELQLKTAESQARMQLDHQKFHIEQVKAEAEIESIFAKAEQLSALAVKAMADAQSVTVGDQFEKYRVQLESLAHDLEAWKAKTDATIASRESVGKAKEGGDSSGATGGSEPGGTPGMAEPPNDIEGPPVSDDITEPLPEPALEGNNPDDGISRTDRLADMRSIARDIRAGQNTGDEGGIPGTVENI